MRCRREWLALLPLLAGCSRSSHLDVTLSADESALVAAALGPDGHVSKVTLCLLDGESSRCSIDPAGADRIQYWTLSASQFIHSDPAMDWRPVRARAADDPPALDSCRRCMMPASSGPQRIHPGDACAVPPTATPRIWSRSGAAVSPDPALRAEVLLDWPGACPCNANPGLGGNLCAFDFEELLPRHARPAAIGVGASGRIAIVTSSAALVIEGDGRRFYTGLNLPDPVVGGAMLDDGGLVTRRQPLDGVVSTLDWFDRDLAPRALMGPDLNAQIGDLRPELAPGTLMLFGGDHPSGTAALFTCDTATTICRRVTGDSFLPSATSLNGAALLSRGVVVAFGQPGIAIFDGLPSALDPGIATQGPTGTIIRGAIDQHRYITADPSRIGPGFSPVSAIGVGPRVFICGLALDQSGVLILTATITPASFLEPHFSSWDPIAEMTVVASSTSGSAVCGTWFLSPAEPNRLLLSPPGSVYDAYWGTYRGEIDPRIELGLNREITGVATSSNGRTIVVDEGGSVFRLSTQGPPELVYGDPEGAFGAARVVLSRSDGFWVFGERTEPVQVEPGAAARFRSIEGLTTDDTVTAGTVGTGEAIWLAGFDAAKHGWLGRIPFGRAKLERLARFPAGAIVESLAELSAQRLIAAITGAPDLFAVDTADGTASAIASPGTARGAACKLPVAATAVAKWHNGPWMEVSASLDRVWAVGCDRRAACVEETAEGQVVAAPCADLSSFGDLVSLRAFCPDHAAISSAEQGMSVRKLIEVTPSGSPEILGAHGTEVPGRFTWNHQLVGTDDDLILATTHGLVGAHNGRRVLGTQLQLLQMLSGARSPSGEMVFGGTRGELVRIKPAASPTSGNACNP